MPDDSNVRIGFDALNSFMIEVFRGLGVPQKEAAVCADVLMAADKYGFDSHGINRLKPIYYDRIKAGILNPESRVEVVRQGPATAVLDGHNGMGMVVARQAMEMAIEKAGIYGLGMVAVRNSTHYGIAGYYAMMAVDAGMIGMTGTNARPSIAPTYGVENMLGTNPLTVGMPTDEKFPFLLDCATAITQRGKIEAQARAGQSVPKGLVIGNDGSILTDAHQVLEALVDGSAALLPLGGTGEELGGHKGYGYATVVEVLSAALQAGSFMKALTGIGTQGEKIPYPLGHFFLAIDPEAFMGRESFRQTTGTILRQLRAAQKIPGYDRIYTAGEKEYQTWQERQKTGVAINESLQKEIHQMQQELSLNAEVRLLP